MNHHLFSSYIIRIFFPFYDVNFTGIGKFLFGGLDWIEISSFDNRWQVSNQHLKCPKMP